MLNVLFHSSQLRYNHKQRVALIVYFCIKKTMLKLKYSSFNIECGTDEAGRGCLAGPVTAAAIILPDDFKLDLLNDSKQLSEKVRQKLKPLIEEKAIDAWYS